MSATMQQTRFYPPCPQEERVEWVLMPVRVPASYSPTSSPTNSDNLYPSYPPTSNLELTYPAVWEQQHAALAFSSMSTTKDVLCGQQFDIDLALMIDAAIHTELSSLPAQYPAPEGSFASIPTCLPELLPEVVPSTAAFMDGAFTGDIWQAGSPSASGSSIGSPAMNSPSGATATPSSTPPTPEFHFCSEPTCFETFSKTADLKRHQRKHRQHFCCPLCKKLHLDKRALDRHLWSRHEDYAIRVGAKSEKTKCRMCDYVSRADNVRRHERSQYGTPSSRK